MKNSLIARAVTRAAVVGVTAAALVAGSTGLAVADDSSSATLRSESGSAPAAAQRKAVTSMSVNNAVVSDRSGAIVSIALGGSAPAGTTRISARVRNGSKVLTVASISASTGRGSFRYYRGYGRGARSVGPIYYYSGNRLIGSQNVNRTFYAKSAVKGKLKLSSRGSAKRAKANVKIYSFTKGKWVAAKKVTLQVRSGGKWRTKKTIRLNRKGTGYHSFRSSSTKKYRLKVAATAKVAGGKTPGIRI